MNNRNINKAVDVSSPNTLVKLIKDGINFEFKDGDNIIKFKGSANFGMETIYFNGEQVSKNRHLGFSSRHLFEDTGHEYEVDILTQNLLKGRIECSVLKDKCLIGRQAVEIYGKNSKKLILKLFFSGVAAGLLGAYVYKNFI